MAQLHCCDSVLGYCVSFPIGSVALQVKWSVIWQRDTANSASVRTAVTLTTATHPAPASFTNFEVFPTFATGPQVNVSVCSCGMERHHREAEVGYMRNREAGAMSVSGVHSKMPFLFFFLS